MDGFSISVPFSEVTDVYPLWIQHLIWEIAEVTASVLVKFYNSNYIKIVLYDNFTRQTLLNEGLMSYHSYVTPERTVALNSTQIPEVNCKVEQKNEGQIFFYKMSRWAK